MVSNLVSNEVTVKLWGQKVLSCIQNCKPIARLSTPDMPHCLFQIPFLS